MGQLLVNNRLWIPANSALAERARLDLHYMAPTGGRQNPFQDIKIYDEVPGYVVAPRHYLPLAKTAYTFNGPTAYPILQETCSIMPWGKTESQYQLQVDAREFLGQYGKTPAESDALVSVRCGEGKTFMGLRAVFDYGYEAVITAHTTDILNEWRKVILETTSLKEKFIGEVISGVYRLGPITLALIHSILALAPEQIVEMQNRFGYAIIDECHHTSAVNFSKISNMFPCRRLGLSATMAREDGLSWVYQMTLGPRLFWKTSTRKKAKVTFRRVRVRDIDYPDNYAEAVSMLAQSKKYLDVLEADIRSSYLQGHKQLVVASRRDLLQALKTRLDDLHPGLNIRETPSEERSRNLRTLPVILAVDHFAKEGLSEPALTHVRVVTPMQDRNAVTQTVGRLERDTEDKAIMSAVFYSSDYFMFLNTLEKTKESLIREGYVTTSEPAQ